MNRDFETFNLRDFVIIDGKKYRVQDVVENKDVPGDSTVFCIEYDNPRIRMQKYSLSEFQKMAEDGRMEVIPSDESTEISEDMEQEDVELLEKRQQVMQEALGLIYPNYDAFEHRRGKEVIQYICDKLCVSDSSARFLLNRYLKSGMNPTSLMDMRQGWNTKDKSTNVVNGRMNKDGTHSKVTLNEETLNNFEMAFRYFKENCGAGVNLSDAYNYLIDIYYTDEDTLEKLPDDECPSYRRFRSYVEKNLKGVSVRDFTKNEREKFKALPEEERKARALPGLQPEDTETVEEDSLESVKTEEEAKIGFEEPVKEEPVKEEPAAEAPVQEEPAAEVPVQEEPVAEEAVQEEPAAEEAVQEEPAAEAPVQEEPVAEAPVQEEPAVEAPVQEEPAVEAPVQEEPAVEAPVQEEPAAEEPVQEEAASEGSDNREQNIDSDGQDEEPVSFEFRNESEKKEIVEESGDIDLDKESDESVFTNTSEIDEKTENLQENTAESNLLENAAESNLQENTAESETKEETPVQDSSESANQYQDVDYIDLDSEGTEEGKSDSVEQSEEDSEDNSEEEEKAKLEQEAEKRKEKKAEREKQIKQKKKLFIGLGALAAAFAVLLFLLLKKPSVTPQETTLLAESETTIEVTTDGGTTASEIESGSTAEIVVETTESTSAEPEKESDTEIIAVSSEAVVETTAPKTSAVETSAPETSPVETTAPETSPVESKTESQTVVVETTVVETLPQETTPAETKPIETKPAETASSGTKPAETVPKETKLAEAEEQKAKVGDYYQITGNNVNIRSKQSRDRILDIAPRGTIVQVTGDSGDPNWIQITHQGQDAVVYSDYVSKNISTEAHGQYYRVTGNHVNVRDAADRSIIYTSLPKGVLIEETGAYYDHDWVRFRWNGKEVVISRQYTETVVDENAPVKLSGGVSSHTTGDYSKEDKGTGVYYRIIADDVNVRDAAYREVAIRSYPKGTVVEKTGDSGDPNWILCKIDHKDVVISANLVEKVETDELSSLYRVKNDNTLLYSDNSKASVLTELPAGIVLRGEKQGENSLWVKTEWKGKTAYACMRDVEAVN